MIKSWLRLKLLILGFFVKYIIANLKPNSIGGCFPRAPRYWGGLRPPQTPAVLIKKLRTYLSGCTGKKSPQK